MKWSPRRIAKVGLLVVVVALAVWLGVDSSARETASHFTEHALQLIGLGDGADAGTIHWCPMHPEIRRSGPGTCPI